MLKEAAKEDEEEDEFFSELEEKDLRILFYLFSNVEYLFV